MLNRRRFLASTAGVSGAMLLPGQLLAQSSIQVEKLNYLELRVSDPERSVTFYQGLFGMPVQSRENGNFLLKIGNVNQYMAIRAVQGNEEPAITRLGYSVSGYDLETQLAALKARGFRQIDPPSITQAGIENPMTTWVSMRGDTPELYFSDARGLIVRLTDPAWCGGSGPTGSNCAAPGPAPAGIMTLNEINHFTVFGGDGAGASEFYQDFFGLQIQAFQGPGSPVNGIGDGSQFIMFGGPPGAANTPANIEHCSFNMPGFIVDDILEKLTDYGLSDRGDSNSRRPGPLKHFISLRMPARGGVEGGTPELYFTDPDNILMQLQDNSYCGGGGYLGEKCLL